MSSVNLQKTSVLITLAALVIIIAGAKAASALLVPFLLAIFIAIICSGPFHWLQKRKVPASLSLLLVIGAVMLGGLLVVTLVGTSVNDFTRDLPTYQEKLRGQTLHLAGYLDKFGIQISKDILLEHFDPGAVMQSAAGMLAKAGGVLTNSFLILLTVIFILFEAAGMPAKLRAALPDADSSLASFEKFTDGVRQYLAIKTFVSLATGLVVALGLTFLGLDYALLWGLIAFLLNYVPNIGSIIAAIPAVLLAIVQLGSMQALIVAILYVAVNVIMGNAVEPKLMGRKLGLSSLVVFISLVFWGWILGPVGMLLSVPLTMIVKIALEVNDSTRWLAILLGSEVPVTVAKK
ncbi:Predicted PurR-regulated permease PerM [Malonomonas rubra DSM 5091]|uniref:Predicted PurR-regulated permease PerM n=1 Tax=Malonomonas rubra DSM 5091 TaxID=1122189 RepID=A0A1M6I1G8_MALRU|nr:AI-2E family transporter [Malonomonas rubra]SHJ28277.1 Predicted PurR-regulated permease PerM [Malonomonas rubra DSM 5091]